MAKIRIDTGSLEVTSKQIAQRVQSLQSLNSRIEKLLNQMSASWKGVASTKYITTMLEQLQKSKKMEEVLREYMKYIDKVKSSFIELDKNSATRIRRS